MTTTEVHLRWDGVYIPGGRHEDKHSTPLWRNSNALGPCGNARSPGQDEPRTAQIMHDYRLGTGNVIRQQRAQVSIVSTPQRFAPGEEWMWIRARIRDIDKVGNLVLQVRDVNGQLVYTERLTQRQVWSLPTTQPNHDPPLKYAAGEPPQTAKDRAGLQWASPAGSPYTVTILTSAFREVVRDAIHGTPALTATTAASRDYDINTTIAPGVDQTNIQVASMSLELVPWAELYETSTGLSAAQAPQAAGVDQTKWVQYKLNELGWFAGKLDGDPNNPDLLKAIIRYRQLNKELTVQLFQEDPKGEDSTFGLSGLAPSSAIDNDLITELARDTPRTLTNAPGVFTDKSETGKIYVDAERFCQDSKIEFADDAADAPETIKYEKEQAWLSAPRFPLRAKTLVTNSGGTAVWAPGASQSIEVRWSWRDKAESTDWLPSYYNPYTPDIPNTTQEYIQQTNAALAHAIASNFHNARDVVGGQITNDDHANKAVVFADVGGRLAPAGAGDPWGATTTGELVFFCPSKIAGDNYKIMATVATHQAETGWMTLWRRIHVTGHVSWGAPPTNAWGAVAEKYAHAYVEIVEPTVTDTMARIADGPLRAAFRTKLKDIGGLPMSDDAWDPRDFSSVAVTKTTPRAMKEALEEILNDGDRAYDTWKTDNVHDVDISARHNAASKRLRDWRSGKDPLLTDLNNDENLIKGYRHYQAELNRISESAKEPELPAPSEDAPPTSSKPAGFLAGLGKNPFGGGMLRKPPAKKKFRSLDEDREIMEWAGDDAANEKAKEALISAPVFRLIDLTRPLVHLHLERILGPGVVVLEFQPHVPVGGYSSQSSPNMMMGGGKVVINRACFGPYDDVHLFAHELAHALFLKHYKNALPYASADHDTSDDNCMMSYIASPNPLEGTEVSNAPHYQPGHYHPEFCGKCNLKLRGWNIRAPGLPERSNIH